MLVELHGRQQVVLSTLERLDRTLHGNGHPGLASDLQRLEGDLTRLESDQTNCPARKAYSEGRSGLRAAWAGVWAAIGLGAIGIVIQLVQLLG